MPPAERAIQGVDGWSSRGGTYGFAPDPDIGRSADERDEGVVGGGFAVGSIGPIAVGELVGLVSVVEMNIVISVWR